MKVERIMLVAFLIALLNFIARAELVAHYTFDDSTAIGQDSTVNGYNVDAYGIAPNFIEDGRIGGAASFDGTQGLVRQTYLFNSSSFSLAFWVKPTAESPVIMRSWANNGGPSISMTRNSFRFFTKYSDGIANLSTWVDGLKWSLQRWQHVVMTFEPTTNQGTYYDGVLRIYHDGVLVNTKTDAKYSAHDWTGLAIGRYSSSYFRGGLDDIRVYNHVLSAQEILEYLESMPSVPRQPAKAIAYYSFDDPNSLPDGMGTDDSGSGFSVAAYGDAPTFVDAGKFGGAANFNGSSQGYARSSDILIQKAFTLSLWLKPNTQSPLVLRSWSSNGGAGIAMITGGFRFVTYYYNAGIKLTYVDGPAKWSSDRWMHIAMSFEPKINYGTYDEGILRVYANGILVNTKTNALCSAHLWLGMSIGRHTSSYFNGSLDDVALFDTVLTDEQIYDLVSGKFNPMYVGFSTGITDLNQDGTTNFLDFSDLAHDWLKESY